MVRLNSAKNAEFSLCGSHNVWEKLENTPVWYPPQSFLSRHHFSMIIASFFTKLQLCVFFRESLALLLTLHSFFLIAKKRRNTVFPASPHDALIVTTSLNTFIIHTTSC
jgi:hypothetical protein